MSNILEIRDLVVDYGIIRAIKGISLQIPQGKIVTILGANGAGKTSTLRTISGMTRASGGKILFKGKNILNKEADVISKTGIRQSQEERMVR